MKELSHREKLRAKLWDIRKLYVEKIIVIYCPFGFYPVFVLVAMLAIRYNFVSSGTMFRELLRPQKCKAINESDHLSIYSLSERNSSSGSLEEARRLVVGRSRWSGDSSLWFDNRGPDNRCET